MARDLTGQRFGRLIAQRRIDKDRWECRCDCGNVTAKRGGNLIHGGTRSCGCYRREAAIERHSTHGMARSATYRSWNAMRNRCLNQSGQDFPDYGGRGITLCDKWRTFAGFLADMGVRPEGTSIDRIDNSKGYGPDNCRWATPTEQANNRRPRTRRPVRTCEQPNCEGRHKAHGLCDKHYQRIKRPAGNTTY